MTLTLATRRILIVSMLLDVVLAVWFGSLVFVGLAAMTLIWLWFPRERTAEERIAERDRQK